MRGIVVAAALSGIVFGAIGSAALAADIPTKAPPLLAAVPGPSTVIFGGASVNNGGWFADAGMVAAFNRNLNTPGALFRIRGGAGHYDYNRSAGVGQDVDYQVGEVMLGYQTFVGSSRLSGYVGANIEHHNNSDPAAVVHGTKWGFKAQGEIYTDIAPNWYGLLLATYSTAYDSYFALGKVGYKVTPIVSVGPELAALGNERFDAVRGGGFAAVNVSQSTQFILSGGYSWDERRNTLNDHSGGYGTVHVRTLF